MIPMWFLDKEERNNRRKEIVEVLNIGAAKGHE